jgi:hypothetical protein
MLMHALRNAWWMHEMLLKVRFCVAAGIALASWTAAPAIGKSLGNSASPTLRIFCDFMIMEPTWIFLVPQLHSMDSELPLLRE